jgi:hypothetical protein
MHVIVVAAVAAHSWKSVLCPLSLSLRKMIVHGSMMNNSGGEWIISCLARPSTTIVMNAPENP